MKWIERTLIFLGFMIVIGGTAVSIGQSIERAEQPKLMAHYEEAKGINTYRMIDYETGVVCYTTIGYLHGSTVTQNCMFIGWWKELPQGERRN